MDKLLSQIGRLALLLTAVVVILGAYTRLTDAGLGCPDWPGCYGFLTVPTEAGDVAKAENAFPERPVEAAKAWNEMIHRYFAGTLGLLILAIFLLSLKRKQPMLLPSVMLVTVCFQAFLGMLTVTMNLMPLVVMGHLLGGFTTFCLLLLFVKQQSEPSEQLEVETNRMFGVLPKLMKIGAVILALQIALGGWTAANYSAVACTSLPICEPGWQDKFALSKAFTVPTGHADYEFGVLSHDVRVSIHITHRLGAVIVGIFLLALSIMMLLMREWRKKRQGLTLLSLLSVQIALGISNVVFKLPLWVAVAHNFIALCLLAYLLHLIWEWRRVSQAQFSIQPQQSFTLDSVSMEANAHVK